MGGQLGNPIGSALEYLGNAKDVDITWKAGIYGINKDSITINSPIGYGILIVFPTNKASAGGGAPILQMAVDQGSGVFKLRMSWVGNPTPWKEYRSVN